MPHKKNFALRLKVVSAKLIVLILVFLFAFQGPISIALAVDSAEIQAPSNIGGNNNIAGTESAPKTQTDTVVAEPKKEQPTFSVIPDNTKPSKPTPSLDSQKAKPIDPKDVSPRPRNGGETDTPTAPFIDAEKPIPAKLKAESEPTTGAFHYEYPLAVPPGRAGMEPQFTLTYTNQTKDPVSAYGFGWSDSIPYIERDNKTGTNNLYDSGFNYFHSSLDGDLGLVSTSGQYKFFGAKNDDGSFRKYTYDTTNNFWVIADKSGTLFTLGLATSTREDNTDGTKVYKWMLEKVQDKNANYVRYEYFKDSGLIYPSKIFYTGHDSADGIFEVDFSTSTNPYPETSYRPGFGLTNNFRINEIDAKVNGSWVKKYVFNYGTGDNAKRNILTTLTETGKDANSNTITLPSTTFTQQTTNHLWSNQGWSFPEQFISCLFCNDTGTRLADVNGDGFADFVKYGQSGGPVTYLNNSGDGTFTASTTWNSPVTFVASGVDNGTRLLDINGDGLVDIVQAKEGSTYHSYLNNGNGWQDNGNWLSPGPLVNASGIDNNWKFGDLNGDGLVDIFRQKNFGQGTTTEIAINNGVNGWNWANTLPFPPVIFNSPNGIQDMGVRAVDVNGDGLVDIIGGGTYINTGNGWVEDPDWSFPTAIVDSGHHEYPLQILDMNGDGLPDVLFASESESHAWINNGHGWTSVPNWAYVNSFITSGADNGTRVGDINGDGLDDVVQAGPLGSGSSNRAFINPNAGNKADMVSGIGLSTGGSITISYKSSANNVDGSGKTLNPSLPFTVDTVSNIATSDGLGGTSSTTYSYKDGSYYYNNSTDRKFAGFNSITSTNNAGFVTKNFYHQGNSSDSSHGEYNDSASKIGRVYRTEIYDDSNNLFSKEINKWNSYSLGTTSLVTLSSKVDSSYDGNSDHKDKAESYIYNNSTGNPSEKIEFGEVAGADDGTFSDTGSDKFTTDFTYAASSTASYISLPASAVTVDQSSTTVRASRYYYDTLSLGDVNKGNLTKEENWKTASTYINSQKNYNSYGLVTDETDPRGKTTTYVYDSYNLFPATTTNPLGQSDALVYDYGTGKPTQDKDPNGYVFQNTYDGFGRITSEKIPDNTTPTTLVTKTIYTYADTGLPRVVQKTNYLNSATSTDSYTYSDGLGRVIQTRTEAKDTNTFSTKDIAYNSLGKILKESLPYFSTGASTTAATTTSALYTNYTYDPLLRVKTIVNALGTTSNTYDNWKLTVTDSLGKVKDLIKDAYDNLVEVDEHNSGSTYSTTYQWNGNKNLTKITDAAGNVRNLTYDGLGRVLTTEDLHAVGDSTFGIWNYSYDDAGNLASSTDPVGHNIVYTYDDLNRRTIENDTANAGNEVVYGYDSCVGGKGKLCYATTTALVLTNEWNPNGQLKKETKNIFGTSYVTSYTNDRQGNPLTITHPDGTVISYAYNNAGQLNKVTWKELYGSLQDLASNISYSPLGQITYLLYGNNASTINTYDAAKLYRLANKVTGTTGTKFQDLAYTYDAVGDITKIIDNSNTNSAKTIDYGYDDLYRLTTASTTSAVGGNYQETYTYSNIGNISTKSDQGTYSYNGNSGKNFANPHAVTSINGSTITYDRTGNLLGTGAATSTWNYQNRLATITSSATTTTYTYDPNGDRLTQKINSTATTTTVTPVYETSGSSETNTKHVYIGDELIATIVGTDQPEINIVTGGNSFAGGGLPGAVLHYVHDDHLGGSNAVSDESATLEELTDYYPYGKIKLDQTTSSFKENKKFTGHSFDQDTQLTYAKARYQNPVTGRFLSEDPAFQSIGNANDIKQKTGLELDQYLSDPQNLNSYSYARNSPLVYVDRDGNLSFKFADFANSRQQYTSEQVQSIGYQNLPYYYRQSGDPGGTLRVNNQKIQDVGAMAASVALMFASGEGAVKGRPQVVSEAVQNDIMGYVKADKSILPSYAQDTLSKLEANGFNKLPGYKGGGVFENREMNLPIKSYGSYREFDVNPQQKNMSRDAQRFVVDMNNKNVYYTDTHYVGRTGYNFYFINHQ